MGILDDAIREHLDLKRAHGAASDDLERLENEAFGPAARPGDPEFDTSEEPAAGTAPDSEAETRVESASAPAPAPAPTAPDTGEEESEVPGIFDVEAGPETKEEDWLASLEDVVDAPATEQPAAPAREPEPEPEPEPESMEQPEAPAPESPPTGESEELTSAERARQEHPDLGDTIPHEAVPDPSEQGPTTDEAEAAPEASQPPEPPESAIFEGDEDFGDLDLELDIEEAEEEVERSTSTEMDAAPEGELEPPTGSSDEFEADDEEEDELEDEDEDLLNETPDFLQDAPEGDRLWFEQGEPKDFDFDDD